MNYEEYMTTLTEQVSDKRAKELVKKEYEDHIEDQTKSFESEGLEHNDALLLAVKEMGDPVEAGIALNKIHRPRFPYGMMAVVFILTIIGVWMQGIIFPHIDNVEISHDYIYKTIFYNVIGIAIILAIVSLDYSIIMRSAYFLYALALLGNVPIYMWSANNYYFGIRMAYYQWLVYPVIFAALLYRNKDRQMKGLIRCIVLSLFYFLCRFVLGNGLINAGMLECIFIVTFVMYFAIYKGLFGKCRKQMYAVSSLFIVPVLGFGGLSVYWVNHPEASLLAEYQRARLEALFYPSRYPNGTGYIPNQLRQIVQSYSLFGNKELAFDRLNSTDLYSTFILSSIFSWFGIIAGVLVIALLIGFSIRAFVVSYRQKNRIGMMLGLVCSISIFFRCMIFILNNFGCGIFYTTSVPFLTYGIGGTVINSVMVGIILCVFRNSSILAERTKEPSGLAKKKVADNLVFPLRS